MLADDAANACGAAEAQAVVRTIPGIETSADRGQWIAP
jgi:hypothetical protein